MQVINLEKISRQLIVLTCIAILLFNTSCNVGSKYNPPAMDAPQTWKNSTTISGACYTDYWWEVFDDSLLNSLEQQVLLKNYDLKVAFNRVQEARALMNVAKADLYPQLYLNPYYNNEGVLYESYSDGIIVRAHELLYLLPLNLSWEMDLWGKIRDRYQAARENWEGQVEAYNSVMLILTADLATVYYQLRTIDAQIDLLKATINVREKELKITKSRYKSKITDYSDVTFAGLELSNTLAQFREIIRIRAELENRLAILIGIPSSEFCFEHSPLQGMPPEIPVGIPSEVLMRRPDIAEAERLIATEHSLVNSAYASFFPSLTLTASAGYSSPHLRYFLKKRSRLWAFGASSSQMIFDGGRLAADLAIQESRFREASEEYKQKVLICLEEVEDALSNLENYAKEFNDISDSVEWAKKAYRIANNRYKNGVTSYLEVMISEQEELASQITQNNLQGLRFVSTIQLIKVIGGGWECNSNDEGLEECN
jgi:outer membrane protein, multidrug efflux system